jgi:class 3 adenylate cyclase
VASPAEPTLRPGWDRTNPWTLRFVDRALEQEYSAAISAPATRRLGLAGAASVPLWVTAAVLAPPLLGVPPAPLTVAALVNATASAVMVGILALRRRVLPARVVWAIAASLAALSGASVVVALAASGVFAAIGAVALMTVGVVAIGIIRPPVWVAAAVALVTLALFVVGVLAVGPIALGVFQALQVGSTLGVAVLGTRLLEETERARFAQAHLVADLHRRIDRLFRQYLSPDIAQVLVEDPGRAELGGEVVDVTVLFADLRGYTSYSERTSPREVVEMLNASFGAAVPAVFAEGGTIVQFAGDALMAIFNAPLRQPDHALRACRAALALQRGVAAMAGAGERPRFRVGINSGPALVGNIGSAELKSFSALGDTTNVAARLQTYASEGSIVIGGGTYQLVRDSAETRSLGTADLKGKSAPTPVYELVGLRDGSGP